MTIRYSVLSDSSGGKGFILNTGSSGDTTFILDSVSPSGEYFITSELNDSTIEVYAIAENGELAGYTNTNTLTASNTFNKVVVYGTTSNDTISFDFKSSFAPSGSGNQDSGAAPFINSVNTTDLPNVDDTIIISGGNFATNVVVTFTGTDAIELDAKSIIRTNSTQLLVTRPDNAIEDNAPFTIAVTNPGIPNSTIKTFTQEVTVGGDPAWQTPPSQVYNLGVGNTITLIAADTEGSDIDYAVIAGSLPAGLTLDGETGVISGTPSGGVEGDQAVFTVRATDTGGNIADREFTFTANTAPTWTTVSSDIGSAGTLIEGSAVNFQFVANGGSAGGALSYSVQSGSLPSGTSLSSSGLLTGTPDTSGSVTFTLRATDEGGLFADKEFTIEILVSSFDVEYLVIAGGGGGAGNGSGTTYRAGGGGGAGGYRSSVIGESSGGGASAESVLTLEPATNYTVTVGAGAPSTEGLSSVGNEGNDSEFSTITAIGGGRGGQGGSESSLPSTGGSGGGAGGQDQGYPGAAGTSGQGFSGGSMRSGYAGSDVTGGGGGGAGGNGQSGSSSGNGGAGVSSSITGSSTPRASGGGGGNGNALAGGGGNGGVNSSGQNGSVNTGGGGGGGRNAPGSSGGGGAGGSGVVILRYPSGRTITIGAGLTGSETTVGANKVATITAGTGNVSFS